MSSRPVIGHRAARSALRAQEVLRLGLSLQLGQRDPATGFGQDLHVRVLWQGAVEGRKGLGQLPPHLGDERVGVVGEVQRGIVGGPLGVEVRRHILVGVAVAVGAPDPDLLASQLLAEGLQYADLEGDAVDARLAVLVRLQDGFLPGVAHYTLERDLLVGRVAEHLTVGVLLHQGQARSTGWCLVLFERKSRASSSGGTMRR